MIKNLIWLLVLSALSGYSCNHMTKAQKGFVIGAGAGGAAGAAIGKARGNTAMGAILGAAVGGLAGGIIGKRMDRQAAEIERIEGAEVRRVGEGINVTFPAGILFGFDQSDLSADAGGKVRELADILNRYPDTYVLVEGHTDATGEDDYNLRLSKRRAQHVKDELRKRQVKGNRIRTAWYGEAQPKFANDSEQNMAKNRRVEFAIYANEKMKKDARNEAKKNS